MDLGIQIAIVVGFLFLGFGALAVYQETAVKVAQIENQCECPCAATKE